jgi:membrane fusion protein (multidrug efflux system)
MLLLRSALLLCGAPLAACDQAAEAPAAAVSAAPPAVTVITLRSTEFTPGFSFNGRVVAVDKVELRARVGGFLELRLFQEGADVAAGDLLFVLEKKQYQAIVEQRRADLASAEASKTNTAAQLERGEELVKNGNIPRSEVDLRRAADLMAAASIQETQAKLRQAQINLRDTEIYAPIAGRISRADFSVGSFVGPDSGVLAIIVGQDPIYVTFPVSQQELLAHRGRCGEPVVRVSLPDGTSYEHAGKLNFEDVRTDPGTDTLTIRAELPNPDRVLIDGQFLGVRVERGEPKRVLMVPQVVVQVNQTGPFVLVVGDDEKAAARPVRLGAVEGLQVVVEDGLSEGERVIVGGIQKVRPGMVVAVSEAEPARPAGQTALQPSCRTPPLEPLPPESHSRLGKIVQALRRVQYMVARASRPRAVL